MILIRATTQSKSSYLIDVVHQKLKRNGGDWIPYDRILGSGQIGESITIYWTPGDASEQFSITTPLTELAHVRA